MKPARTCCLCIAILALYTAHCFTEEPPHPPANDDSFEQKISGNWTLETVNGRPVAEVLVEADPDQPGIPAVAVFNNGRLLFKGYPSEIQGGWNYAVDPEAEPRRIRLERSDQHVPAILRHDRETLLLAVNLDGGTPPDDFKNDAGHLVLGYRRDPKDPDWLERVARAYIRDAQELRRDGAPEQQEHAATLEGYAASLQKEVELRQRSQRAMDAAAKLKAEGKLQSAKQREDEAVQLRVEAELVEAERLREQRVRDFEYTLRWEVQQLADRVAALRSEGRFDEAREVESQLSDLLRDQDSRLKRANDLKKRAAIARLNGQPEDAELFDREAERLLAELRPKHLAGHSDLAAPSSPDHQNPLTREARGDQELTQLFKVRFIDPSRLAEFLSKNLEIGFAKPLTEGQQTNTLIVNADPATLELAARLIELLDVNRNVTGLSPSYSSEGSLHAFFLNNVKASAAHATLLRLFATKAFEDEAPLVFYADDATNTLLVRYEGQHLEQIKQLVRQLDSDQETPPKIIEVDDLDLPHFLPRSEESSSTDPGGQREREVRQRVEREFDARQQAQREKLEILRERLHRIQDLINSRDRLREAIINQRVEELLEQPADN